MSRTASRHVAGIDAGSRTVKVLVLSVPDLLPLGAAYADAGTDAPAMAAALLERLLRGLGRPAAVVATGYGRERIAGVARTVTEIACHAAGCRHLFPRCRTVIDMGGQDCKLIRLAADGSVADFALNDRCAAGTGRFLEMAAARLGVELAGLGRLAARSRSPAVVNATCAVFAETEITGLLNAGARPADILAGTLRSVAARLAGLAARAPEAPLVFTGGGALVPALARELERALGMKALVPGEPLLTGALGAALLAAADAQGSGGRGRAVS